MEKLINFTSEQKSLIWEVLIQPKGGTKAEARHFIEVCEMYGLNPLANEIVFQKYETRQGPRVNFITTRDGFLKIAEKNPNYDIIQSGVVKEGDQFSFDVPNGVVIHSFGSKRGKILGAWAVAFHKKRKPIAVFVDFEEYFKANAASQNERGGSPIWDKFPSAMIQKTAEVFALRRQFSISGIVAAEEMGVDLPRSDEDRGAENGGAVPITPTPNPEKPPQESKVKVSEQESKKEEKIEEDKPVKREENEKQLELNDKQSDQSTETNETNGEYKLLDYQAGISPSGIPFAKIKVERNGEVFLVLAKDKEAIEESEKIPQNKPFDMEIHEENGFKFLKKVLEKVS
ncbi:recombinase RecT [Microaerobacter geothermalis]|uniref:RecT family recombinase n=1 Tax=Microaerobacter geothermalis TaxID=674972 RepID=UPI001F35308E|nr:RecT family recombinase [Microaerobacter geothermalis]MCF6094534.1 recombinase RecT [Microaerobacter geothermalis]